MSATPDVANAATPKTPRPQRMHPAFEAVAAKRAASAQLRIADGITAFAGSMKFVYVHIAVFVVWMIVFERSPWPTLTLVVSLEAIFLSTFVMIGQNRAASFQQAKATHDFNEQELELKTNTQLTRETPHADHGAAPSADRADGRDAGRSATASARRYAGLDTRVDAELGVLLDVLLRVLVAVVDALAQRMFVA